jgi:hypothetical protein
LENRKRTARLRSRRFFGREKKKKRKDNEETRRRSGSGEKSVRVEWFRVEEWKRTQDPQATSPGGASGAAPGEEILASWTALKMMRVRLAE